MTTVLILFEGGDTQPNTN